MATKIKMSRTKAKEIHARNNKLRYGVRHDRAVKKITPLPPKSTWGNDQDFEAYMYSKYKGWQLRCQAFSTRQIRDGHTGAQAQCPNRALDGEDYCKRHFGKRQKRKEKVAKVRTVLQTSKRYNTSIPEDILKRFIDMADDPDRLALTAELDLITARAGQLLERIDTRESKRAWTDARAAEIVLRESIKSQDPNGIRRGMNMLRNALNKSDYPIWHELINTIHNRRVLVESERKRMVEQAQVITMDGVMILLYKLQEIIINNVPDEATQNAISTQFRRLIAPDPLHSPQLVIEHEAQPEGCEVCNNEDFVSLQLQDNPSYTCPECGRVIKSVKKATSKNLRMERKRKTKTKKPKKRKRTPNNRGRKANAVR